MKDQRYYNERARYMRQMAKEAQTEKLQKTCLKAAEAYEILAAKAAKAKTDPQPDE